MDENVYADRVSGWLVNQKHFTQWPLAELGWVNPHLSGDYFYRLDNNSLVLVTLIRASGYSTADIVAGLKTEFDNLERVRLAKKLQFANQIVICVFAAEVEESIEDQLLAAKQVSAVSRCYLTPWLVELDEARLITTKGLPPGNFGLLGSDSPLKYPELAEDAYTRPPAEQQAVSSEARQGMMRRAVPWVSYSLIGVCVLVSLLTGFSTNTQTLVDWGAKVNSMVAAGQYWRLLTAAFLHVGLLHLAFNMVFLYYLGPTVERFFGPWRFFVIYVLAGIAGNLSSFAFSTSVSVGASGALFGIMGAYLYFWWRTPEIGKRIGRDVIILILFNLAYGQINPSVDNWAHLGGLIGGFLISAVVGLPTNKVPVYTRVLALALFAIFVAWAFTYGVQHVL
ncbi:MAG: rhomboid family intramembrane serine protease [Peptococcaceae bacterium]|nr:rhomboid family intramembrane serine protease [Peptococcaceae bacterium]